MSKDALNVELPVWAQGLPEAAKTEVAELVDELDKSRNVIAALGTIAKLGKQTAEVVHELRQPISGIKSFTQMILEKPAELSPEQIKRLEVVLVQTDRIEEMLEKLRLFSKPDEQDVHDVLLSEPYDAVEQLLARRLLKKNIELQTVFPDGELKVQANSTGLQQVLLNLFQNSLDAMADAGQGRIRVMVEAEADNTCRITVADSGPGVPAELRDKIFLPFFTTKSPEKGTGLGLVICNEILRGFGTKLRLLEESELDEGIGAAFSFQLRQSGG